jgi:hypothetical protein
VSSNSEIAPNTIYGATKPASANDNVVANSIAGSDLAPNSVASGKVVDSSLGSIDLAPNSVDTSELTDRSVTLSKLAPWNVEANVIDRAGPLPLEGSFRSDGGVVLLTVSGSAFRNSTTPGKLGFRIVFDNLGTLIDTVDGYTSERFSHKALPTDQILLHGPPGLHTIRLEARNNSICGDPGETSGTYCTATDANDTFSVSAVEFPGRPLE